jgi:protein-disulfide isomerase
MVAQSVQGQENEKDVKPPAGTVAVVAGKPITLAELDAAALGSNIKLAQDVYEARAKALEQLILERALGPKAAEAKQTVDEYLAARTTDATTPVTDAEVEAFYNSNKTRMPGKTLEQMSAQIRAYLVGMQKIAARDELVERAKKEAGVKIYLEAPRAELAVSADSPAKGPADAKVTVVEFSDFQCPFCSQAAPIVGQIHAAYGDKVRIIFQHFPLGIHDRARPAAEASACANVQGKFWEYHDKLFYHQQSLSDADLKKYAEEVGLDADRWSACYRSGTFRAEVMQQMQIGRQAGVTGTPAFFVNGRFVSGAQPFEKFKDIIDDELKN